MHPTVNWVLLYKSKDGLPSEFVELLVHASTVICCTGKVRTWGKRDELSYDNTEKAIAAFSQKQSEMEASGFLLTREWHFDPTTFDYDLFAREVAISTRKAFTAIREAHPSENITGFAVISDDSVMTIGPVANSAEAFAAVDNAPDTLWDAAEWACWEGGEYFDIPYRMLLTRRQYERVTVPFDEFRTRVIEACITALEELDKEGFFGDAQDRENRIVLFQIMDSEYLDEGVKRLNAPGAYERFRAWWQSWN